MLLPTNFINSYGMFNYFFPMYCHEKDPKSRQILYLIIQKFQNVFCSRFEYENLPDETMKIVGDNNFIELMMYFAPAVAWFKDDVLGLQCLPTIGEYKFNIVGKPTAWRVVGLNGYQKELTEDNSVLMYNDKAYTIPLVHILYEAGYMVELDRTHAQQIKAQRKPLLMELEEDEKKSGETFVNQLLEFKDVIITRLRGKKDKKNKSIGEVDNPYNTQVFDTLQEFQGKAFMDDYKEFENRVLTYLGINNVNIEKRERLLTGEISANDMIIQTNYTSALSSRKEAIEKVNKMFGVNISIKPRELESLQSGITSQYEMAGGNIQNVNNRQNTVQRQDDTQ